MLSASTLLPALKEIDFVAAPAKPRYTQMMDPRQPALLRMLLWGDAEGDARVVFAPKTAVVYTTTTYYFNLNILFAELDTLSVSLVLLYLTDIDAKIVVHDGIVDVLYVTCTDSTTILLYSEHAFVAFPKD